jgi:hypothetical protein
MKFHHASQTHSPYVFSLETQLVPPALAYNSSHPTSAVLGPIRDNGICSHRRHAWIGHELSVPARKLSPVSYRWSLSVD